MVEISTSLLSVEKENIIKTIYDLEVARTDYFHIDVMDGEFVPKNTNSKMQEYCEYIKSISNIPLDVHLMVKNVKDYIKSYLIFEPNILTFQIEAVTDFKEIMELISFIKDNNCRVGVSIKPDTKIEVLYDILPYLHLVLIMAVEPGMGGQELILDTVDKVANLKKYIDKNGFEIDIQIDGGINLNNIGLLKDAGANIIVSGTGIIETEDYTSTISQMSKS